MLQIRDLTPADWPAVEAIYAAGIATGDATFETEPPPWQEFDTARLPDHRLVAVEEGEVVGWAALSRTSSRACYEGVVEHSVYVAERAQSRGIGRALMEALLASAEAAGIWTIQTSIFPENIASLLAPARRIPRGRPARADRTAERRMARHAPPRAQALI